MCIRYERFCFPVILKCNLRCELCAERSPYYERPYNPSLENLKEQLDELFKLVEYIDKFDITGGEPFLRPDLADIIRYIFEKFRTKIGKIRVTTNGTLAPDLNFVDVAKLWGNDFFIIVDNYSVSTKCDSIKEILEVGEIPFEIRDYSGNLYCDGWVDYGDLSIKHTKKKAKEIYKKCAVPKLGFFTCLVNGSLFPCAKARLLYEKRIVNVSMCLFDEELTKNGKIARMKSLLEEEVIEACKYCNGLCDDSPRYIPAVQLTNSKKKSQKSIEPEDSQVNYRKILIYTQTYNNEKTISRTIDSVLNQTNQNYLYFICNNGSTDDTKKIILKYAKEYKNMICFESERNDLLAALLVPNRLFLHVPRYRDNYYCIVDGDDSIQPNFVEKVIATIDKSEVDMIVPAYNRLCSETEYFINSRILSEDIVVSGNEKVKNFMKYRPMLLCQWGKIYKYKKYQKTTNIFLYSNYFSIPKWFHQLDTVGVLSIYYQSDKVAFIAEPIYNYYVSSLSTYGNYMQNRIQNDVLMFKIYNDFLSKFEPVNKINLDYCYAIFLSLINENLNSIINAESVNCKQKLHDILDILRAKETKKLFLSEFSPMFENLANKRDFLVRIYNFLRSLPSIELEVNLINEIIDELNKYGNYSLY